MAEDVTRHSRIVSTLEDSGPSIYTETMHDLLEPVFRLVGGESRCAGALELNQAGEWRPVGSSSSLWTLKAAAVACRELDCGSPVSVGERKKSSKRPVWWIYPPCLQFGSRRECAESLFSSNIVNLTCSDSVRLLGGTELCSGGLEVNSDPSDPSWSSVCEADFDQQDAQVVCRQLGCGAPSVLQGALYGEGEAPMGTKEFQCGGHESALLDCSSASERSTCSPGTAVSLTCSEPYEVRLVGGSSRCAGDLEGKHQGEWRPVRYYSLDLDAVSSWELEDAAVACRDLDSAVSVGKKESSERPAWDISSACLQSGSLRDCARSSSSRYIVTLICSEPAHQVTNSCVYHLFVFSHNFSSESRLLSVTLSGVPSDPGPFIIRAVVLPLTLLLVTVGLYFYCKATRGRRPSRQEDIELDYYNLGVPAEEEGAQGAE
ncbi:scavenger receptor cysteine-rich type 1 protein M130-like [Gymnodraco acuticeps]|uniref:Scavenger receptor cysteine-rich type 1 protein M130-like n=1 Tax=Gymnodraco acuticeps TaxID=8218 RepID=A0A6P8WYV6_GYMAC|nr:scavenger receptor cysteine-rich type 1 protein M130-like [Gymnodraco acuticeps]